MEDAKSTITTQRLSLVPYYAGMVRQQHVDWLNDRETMRYSEQRHRSHSEETQHSYLNLFDRKNDYIWLIRTKTNGEGTDIGTITALVSPENSRANMGILIGEKIQWGKGYGTEAWKGVMGYLWRMGVRKIEAGCMQSNVAMQCVCKNAGMSVEGVKLNHFIFEGMPKALIQYGVYK